MRVLIIIQARMTSSRLPGKVLKSVLDKPLLEYQIERLKRVKLADEILIATTTNKTDQPIVDFCDKISVPYFRGSEGDVLSRYYYAAVSNKGDVIVRITSDCPLIDPQIVDEVIDFYLKNHKRFDYVSNILERSYPRGMDTEVFPLRVLEKAHLEARKEEEREHVTPFIYRNPQQYKLANVKNNEDQSEHRWTVDTIEDFELIRKIIEEIYPLNPHFGLTDILGLLRKNPQWKKINEFIEQKRI